MAEIYLHCKPICGHIFWCFGIHQHFLHTERKQIPGGFLHNIAPHHHHQHCICEYWASIFPVQDPVEPGGVVDPAHDPNDSLDLDHQSGLHELPQWVQQLPTLPQLGMLEEHLLWLMLPLLLPFILHNQHLLRTISPQISPPNLPNQLPFRCCVPDHRPGARMMARTPLFFKKRAPQLLLGIVVKCVKIIKKKLI